MEKSEINTLVDLFRFVCEAGSGRQFMYRQGREIQEKSSSEFQKDVLSFAEKLGGAGERGAYIPVITENSYACVVCVFALILSGNIPVLIDKAMEVTGVTDICRRVSTDLILYPQEYRDKAEIPGITALCYTDPTAAASVKSLNEMDFPLPAAGDTALVFLTSGSTGLSKMVPLSHKNIISQLEAIKDFLEAGTGRTEEKMMLSGTTVLCLPLHHVFGMITHLLYALYTGLVIFITRSFREFTADIKEVQPSVLVLVPALFNLLSRGSADGKALREAVGENLKLIVTGGTAFTVDPKVFHDAGIRITSGYGMTETASTAACFFPREGEAGTGVTGPAIKGVTIKISETGEILLKGDIVFGGYLDSEDDNAEAFADGYFRTGDIGYLDESGRLYITGRLKNLIILPNGENVPAEHLEQLVLTLPMAEECVVTDFREKITAFVYSPASNLSETELRAGLAAINADLPIAHNITDCRLMEIPFPKLSNGKTDRKKFLETLPAQAPLK